MNKEKPQLTTIQFVKRTTEGVQDDAIREAL